MKKRNEDTEKKLVEACINLFSSKGFKGTSIRDIAEAMGMSIQNIYHYFGSKEGLRVAILKHSFEPLFDRMKRVSDSEMDPLERFKLLVRTHIIAAEERRKETFIFFHFMNEEYASNEAAALDRDFQRKILDLYLKEVHSLKSSGYLPGRSPSIVAFNTIAVVNWFTKWYKPDGPLSLEEVIEEMLLFIIHGIQPQMMDNRTGVGTRSRKGK
jgi:AcrR family transcriptional regulator